MGESREYVRGGFDSILTDKGNAALINGLQQQLDISKEQAAQLFQRTVVYTHGIASLVVAGVLDCTEERAYSIVLDFATDQIALTDADLDVEAIMLNASKG